MAAAAVETGACSGPREQLPARTSRSIRRSGELLAMVTSSLADGGAVRIVERGEQGGRPRCAR